MSSLVARSRCLRVAQVQQRHLHLHSTRYRCASGVTRPCSPRPALFHSSARELPKPKRTGITSSRSRPKLASPSSVARTQSPAKFKARQSQDVWQLRGSVSKRRRESLHDEPPPQAQATPAPAPRRKKTKAPSPRELTQLLGRRSAASSSLPEFDPSAPSKLDAELGIHRPFAWDRHSTSVSGGEGAPQLTVKERKLALRKQRRFERRQMKLRREMDEVAGVERGMRRRGVVGPVKMSRALWREIKWREKEEARHREREAEKAAGGLGEQERQSNRQPSGHSSSRTGNGVGLAKEQDRPHWFSSSGSALLFSPRKSETSSSPSYQRPPAPAPSPSPADPLDFSTRKQRQQSWSSTMEKSWSTVGLPSSSQQRQQGFSSSFPYPSSSPRTRKGMDTRSLAALTARTPRARFSPSAWASATSTRFSAPSPGRLGVGGAAGATSRYRRSVDVERMRRRVLLLGGGEEPRVFDADLDLDPSPDSAHDRERERRGDMEAYGFSRRKDRDTAAPAAAESERVGAADFSRKMGFAKSRAVEEALQRDGQYEVGEEVEEFYQPPRAVTSLSSSSSSSSNSKTRPAQQQQQLDLESSDTAHTFSSPPLLPGFLSALREMFGAGVKPTLIQGLSVRWLLEGFGNRFTRNKDENKNVQRAAEEEGSAQEDAVRSASAPATAAPAAAAKAKEGRGAYRQFLLAAETGSGKSIAYLLPLLQNLKLTESAFRARRKMIMTTTTTTQSTPPSSSSTSHFHPHPPPHLQHPPRRQKAYEHSPRALILAPTHELARQLAVFAKNLLHFPDTRLRVMCASLGNTISVSGKEEGERKELWRWEGGRRSGVSQRTTSRRGGWAKDDMLEGVVFDNDLPAVRGEGELPSSVQEGQGRKVPADVFVGTPFKLLEMVWGRGMDKLMRRAVEASRVYTAAAHPGDPAPAPAPLEFGRWRTKNELGLENVEYVVVDEADVLFDKDFEETTRLLLADIAAARGHPVPYILNSAISPSASGINHKTALPLPPTPIAYPFHLILTSATIPSTLNTYLTHAHPHMVRLASPRLHKLPKGLSTEYVDWSGGNKWRDVLYRLKRVWAEDAMLWRADRAREGVEERRLDLLRGLGRAPDLERSQRGREGAEENQEQEQEQEQGLSKVVIFCNASRRVEDLGRYLEENGVPNVPVTSGSERRRQRSSNSYLQGFLKEPKSGRAAGGTPAPRKWGGGRADSAARAPAPDQALAQPNVLITTSLLSRGLDFSSEVKHVFIIDQPRNMVDFLHRAGRAGRAGQKGKVVVFGKMRGRGSARYKEVRGQVRRLGR